MNETHIRRFLDRPGQAISAGDLWGDLTLLGSPPGRSLLTEGPSSSPTQAKTRGLLHTPPSGTDAGAGSFRAERGGDGGVLCLLRRGRIGRLTIDGITLHSQS